MARITIDGHDVTEHVGAMYDAIVASADWGSDFLDVETIVSILAIGKLAGFQIPRLSIRPPSLPSQPILNSGEERHAWLEARFAEWNAQVMAMVDAKVAEANGDA